MSSDAPKPDIFFQLKNQARATAAMLAGMQLELFTPLSEGSLTVDQLADRLEVNNEKLGPLLYVLVFVGLLEEDDGLFSNTQETNTYLVKGQPKYFGDIHKIWYANLLATLQSAETIRTGIPQAKYDWESMDEDELMELHEGMSAGYDTFAKQVSQQFEFSRFRRLLDAGGGSGTFAIAMVEENPQLTATVYDLPEVTPITHKFVQRADASNRVDIISGDLRVDTIPGTYDVAILGSVIQTISPKSARKVIENVGSVIQPGGWLFIFGSGMLHNSRRSPGPGVLQNLIFINTYDHGQSYTEGELFCWLTDAGFDNVDFRYDELTITAVKS
jgi:tRNA A58 N-methylase Trm61